MNASVPASAATGASASAAPSAADWSVQKYSQPAGGEQPLEAGLVGALGQPEAAGLAEAAPVRAQARVELQVAGRARSEHRKHRVGRRGGEQLDPAGPLRVGEQPQEVAVE